MSHKLSDNANFPMSRPFASGVLGEFEYLLITAAARLGEDAYGAVIRREIEEATGRRRSIGALYTTLDRLQTKGSLRPGWAKRLLYAEGVLNAWSV
jgi:hypothetical protein